MEFFWKGLTEKDYYKQIVILSWGALAFFDLCWKMLIFDGWMFFSFVLYLCIYVSKLIHFTYKKEDYYKKNTLLYKEFIKKSKKEIFNELKNDKKNFCTPCFNCRHYDGKNKYCSLEIDNKENINFRIKTSLYTKTLCFLWNRDIPKELLSQKELFKLILQDIKVGHKTYEEDLF